jgi:hypothetical protein
MENGECRKLSTTKSAELINGLHKTWAVGTPTLIDHEIGFRYDPFRVSDSCKSKGGKGCKPEYRIMNLKGMLMG